jgi:hypothetical protein
MSDRPLARARENCGIKVPVRHSVLENERSALHDGRIVREKPNTQITNCRMLSLIVLPPVDPLVLCETRSPLASARLGALENAAPFKL